MSDLALGIVIGVVGAFVLSALAVAALLLATRRRGTLVVPRES